MSFAELCIMLCVLDLSKVSWLTYDQNASYSPALMANHEEAARALSYIVSII